VAERAFNSNASFIKNAGEIPQAGSQLSFMTAMSNRQAATEAIASTMSLNLIFGV